MGDVVTPLLAALFHSPNTDALNIVLREAEGGQEAIVLGLGTFVGTIVNFLVIALALFAVIKAMNRLKKKQEEASPAPPEPSAEEKLLTEIRDLLRDKP